ncbi:hypothetical protein CPT_Madawaska_027 [Staphylococcus phage Madawaska]|nr:hypothetical protein CPT_Madawaska_027 [Staphylococcus phage Madawaska]
MLKNKNIEINQDIIDQELMKTKYMEEAMLKVLNQDLVINLRFLKDNLLSDWEFENNTAEFKEIEKFYDPSLKIRLIFKVNNEKEIKYTLNEDVQDMLENFMIKKADDERACQIIKSVIEYEFFKKENKKGHDLDMDTIDLLMGKVNELKIKYNISNKQAKKLYIAF